MPQPGLHRVSSDRTKQEIQGLPNLSGPASEIQRKLTEDSVEGARPNISAEIESDLSDPARNYPTENNFNRPPMAEEEDIDKSISMRTESA